MKKVLSIVLSIVMVLCMMPAMAFADTTATFSDAADIEYNEAVDVLYAAGIIDGMPDGSFVPNGNVTREQAAKLIATVLLGDKAEKLATDVAPFTDVAADRWSAGYIAYGVEKGILAGVGNGAFDPTGNVTALQLAKMLLIVQGYDANIEGLTGDKWGVNASTLAEDNGLFNGNDAVLVNNAATREEAALYILNTLVADVMTYADKGTNVTLPDGTTIVSGASAAATTTAAGMTAIGNTNVVQVGEKYVADLELDAATTAENYGRPANKWTYDNTEVGVYDNATPIATYTTTVKEKAVFADLGVKGTAATISAIYVDGETYATNVAISKTATGNMDQTGEGALVEVYKDVNDVITMVVINEYYTTVERVIKADEATETKRQIELNDVAGLSNDTFETEDFAKDDKVIITISNDAVKSVKLVEKVEDVAVDGYTTTTVDFGGKTYKYSAKEVADNAYDMATATYTFYFDSYGNIIENETYTAASKDYVMPVQIGTVVATDGISAGYQNVKYVDLTGTATIVPVTTTEAGTVVTASAWSTVKADKDYAGKSNFTTVAAVTATTTAISSTTPVYGSIKTNASTVFVLKTKADTWKAFTGISNLPGYTTQGGFTKFTLVAVNDAVTGYADAVYIDVVGAKAADSNADEVIYVLSTADTDVQNVYDKTNKLDVKIYPAIVGGVKTTVKVTSGTAITAGAIKVASYNNVGYINGFENVTGDEYALVNATVATGTAITYSEPTLVTTVGAFSASSAKVYIIGAENSVTVGDVTDLVGTVDGSPAKITVIYTSKDNKTVATIYFEGKVK